MVRQHALLVALLVVLAGCGLGPSGPAGSPEGSTITHPVEVASTTPSPYELQVTITRDGETVFEDTVTGGEAATYRELTTLESSGTYTVTVESNITGKLGGKAGTERTLTVAGGERTSIVVNPGNVSVVQQPKSPGDSHLKLGVTGLDSLDDHSLLVVVRRDGEEVYRRNLTSADAREDDRRLELLTADETGTYQILIKHSDSFFWKNETFVVPTADKPEDGVTADIGIYFGGDVNLEVLGTASQRGDEED